LEKYNLMAEWICSKCGYELPYERPPVIPPRECPKCGSVRSFRKP